eukprot:2499433-Rhodomonas_salina.1
MLALSPQPNLKPSLCPVLAQRLQSAYDSEARSQTGITSCIKGQGGGAGCVQEACGRDQAVVL